MQDFTPELGDGLSLESEWQCVSSNLRDSCQFSGQSYQCFSLDGPDLSSDFPTLLTLFPICERFTLVLIGDSHWSLLRFPELFYIL